MGNFNDTGFSEGTYSWRQFLVGNIGSATGEYGIPFSLLPEAITPAKKQIQLAVDPASAGEMALWPCYDLGTGVEAPDDYYTVSPEEVVTTGIPCWGIRCVFTAVGTAEVAEIRAWDHNGDLIPLEADWFDIAQDGTNDPTNGAKSLDSDRTSHHDDEAFDIRFPRQYAVAKVGFSDSDAATTNDLADTATISLNVGTWAAESWSEMAALTGLDDTYPVWHSTFDPDLDMLYATPADGSLSEGGTVGPYITLNAALTDATDEILMWRETRQDRLWVQPVPGAFFRSYDWYWLCKQILFIAQEASELEALKLYLDEASQTAEYDYTVGGQQELYLNHASTDTYIISDISLLTGIPGTVGADVEEQLIVETGDETDGKSTVWTALTVDSGWNASGTTVTLGAATALDVRIRRDTKVDDLWFDSEDIDPNNFSVAVNRLQAKQAVFAMQEMPAGPFIEWDSILYNSHYPRRWNWLRYVWSGSNPMFGGPPWFEDNPVIIWKNYVRVPPGDYTWGPGWFKWGTDPFAGDIIDVRTVWPWNMGGYIFPPGDDPDDVSSSPSNPPPHDAAPYKLYGTKWNGMNSFADSSTSVGFAVGQSAASTTNCAVFFDLQGVDITKYSTCKLVLHLHTYTMTPAGDGLSMRVRRSRRDPEWGNLGMTWLNYGLAAGSDTWSTGGGQNIFSDVHNDHTTQFDLEDSITEAAFEAAPYLDGAPNDGTNYKWTVGDIMAEVTRQVAEDNDLALFLHLFSGTSAANCGATFVPAYPNGDQNYDPNVLDNDYYPRAERPYLLFEA
jgi:hypothetical protein